MYIDDEELRGLYKTSATEHIQAIESALMLLEKQPQNMAPLKELLRSAHTLKGDSRMLGVEDVETLVHQIEECLMPLEKGGARMTDELCDRLYAGLDSIKKLAHTAVTGEANDVNMFYTLATLMGDGAALQMPTFAGSDTRNEKQIASPASISADLDDDSQSFGWVTLSDEEAVFNTPKDVWVHEDDRLPVVPISELDLLPWSVDSALNPPAPSQLQADFLDLAAELFPSDSTLPQLDRGTDFGDFNLLPNTVQPAASLDSLDLEFGNLPFLSSTAHPVANLDPTATDDRSLFSLDDDFILTPDRDELATLAIDRDDVFATFDNMLVPTADDLAFHESSLFPEALAEPLLDARIVEPASTPMVKQPPATAPAATDRVTEYQIDTIRVEAKQLDALMGQSGEINVINQQIVGRLTDLELLLELWENGTRDLQQIQTMLQQIPTQSPIHRQLQRNERQWEQMGALISKFKKSIDADSSRLDLITSALESGVKKLRLLPFSTIFNLYPRMVRDLAKSQAKEINFTIEGGDLLLDKRLLEEIKDPLMHILRNAIDHGIETPAERQQSGKFGAATLMIQVRQVGNQTTIEILDDGRGLDVQRIKATAIKRGLHTSAELDQMSIDRIQSLIFASGFSTRTRVTELSGRGVGLDIVRTNIERIKGSVEVESSPDRGCTFRIQLSHAIGSSQVMMVDVRDRRYAIPVEFVDRMLLVNKAEIFALGGVTTTQIDGRTITVAWLADLLALPAIAPNSPGEINRTPNSIACLLLQSGRQQLALLVDRINDRQLVTIEAPHPILKNVPHLAGSTILGTGEVCLVLNPIDLFATAAGDLDSQLAPNLPTPIAKAIAPAILLVEDSLVIRTQMTRILQGAGYRVTAANDGLAGWETLQSGKFDLVVSDVEMPRWGGLQLTTEIRSHSEYQNLPVVLVTTLSQAADRDRGFQAGANAYLTKGDFDQQLLLDTLDRLV
ncbi:hybrid sensor histidine kinase/response regulator [Chamaesiphon sp. GL140_3_metabinner_50]|uniref:hybrid sensor histidine kinase/response regulator n=1 Tax=Chamaesiphon sp. GL140_3_metabinner_50 TaxID=2970812 RepID=UPI0025EE83A3|nr:hybrid sensor histidine kinase/response regulator [Chamaesiphon sp. GL140_3_metabinner_50]